MKIRTALLCAVALCALHARAQTPPAAAPSQPAKSTPSPATDSSATKAAIDPRKEKDIRQLLDVAGTKTQMAELMDGMETNIKPVLQNALPAGDYRDKLIDAFIVKFRSKLDLNQLLELAIPLYDQSYSDAEIKDLIAFYQTPLGQKVVRVSPAMTSEMMARGQKLGEELGRASMLEVLAEHPEFEKQIEQAQQSPAAPAAKPQ